MPAAHKLGRKPSSDEVVVVVGGEPVRPARVMARCARHVLQNIETYTRYRYPVLLNPYFQEKHSVLVSKIAPLSHVAALLAADARAMEASQAHYSNSMDAMLQRVDAARAQRERRVRRDLEYEQLMRTTVCQCRRIAHYARLHTVLACIRTRADLSAVYPCARAIFLVRAGGGIRPTHLGHTTDEGRRHSQVH